MKARHWMLAAGVIVSTWLAFFGDKTPDVGIADAASRRTSLPTSVTPRLAAKSAAANENRADKGEPVILALVPRDTLIGGAHAEKPAEGLFASQSWTPMPPLSSQKKEPTAPTAPPLPFTYLGKKLEDGVWEVYLARGEQTVIARVDSEIEGTYRVESIKPPTLSLIYLPLKQAQTLPIGGTD